MVFAATINPYSLVTSIPEMTRLKKKPLTEIYVFNT